MSYFSEKILSKENLTKKILIGIIFILVAVGIYTLIVKNLSAKDPAEAAKLEAIEAKKSLSRHLVLPDGDEPDIRKITKKVDDPFFARAEIGDYLMIFYKSRIAYIYSPSKDIISNAGVVFVNPQLDSSKKEGVKPDLVPAKTGN